MIMLTAMIGCDGDHMIESFPLATGNCARARNVSTDVSANFYPIMQPLVAKTNPPRGRISACYRCLRVKTNLGGICCKKCI